MCCPLVPHSQVTLEVQLLIFLASYKLPPGLIGGERSDF